MTPEHLTHYFDALKKQTKKALKIKKQTKIFKNYREQGFKMSRFHEPEGPIPRCDYFYCSVS